MYLYTSKTIISFYHFYVLIYFFYPDLFNCYFSNSNFKSFKRSDIINFKLIYNNNYKKLKLNIIISNKLIYF